MRIAWQFQSSETSLVYTKVYVNGIAVGVEKSTLSLTYVSVSDDIINIKYNDLIQIYARCSSTFMTCYVRNMDIKYTENFVNNDP